MQSPADPMSPSTRVPKLISYAQNGEDILLHRALQGVERGFYVDVGAWDPVIDSVTKHFYDRGWRGINIEPGEIFHKLAAERPEDINLQVAVSDRSGLIELYESESNTGLSSIDEVTIEGEAAAPGFTELVDDLGDALNRERRPRVVNALTLEEIFNHYLGDRTIDFLKIDVEGHERQVIAGNDWQRFRPRIVVVEATRPLSNEPAWVDWEFLLVGAGYSLAFFDGLNRYYVRNESSELVEWFEAPANVLDGFMPYAQAELTEEIERRQEYIAALTRDLGAALKEHEALRQAMADVRAERSYALEGLSALEAAIAEKNGEIASLQEQLASAEQMTDQVAILNAELSNARLEVVDLTKQNQDAGESLAEREIELVRLSADLAEALAALKSEQRSLGHRLLKLPRALTRVAFPPGSTRGRAYTTTLSLFDRMTRLK